MTRSLTDQSDAKMKPLCPQGWAELIPLISEVRQRFLERDQQSRLFWGNSEGRKGIQRRTRSQRYPQRGSREQKFVAIQLARMLHGFFEIQIIENAHGHRDERQAMQRVGDRRR
jgi:hypothetical protein